MREASKYFERHKRRERLNLIRNGICKNEKKEKELEKYIGERKVILVMNF